MSTAAKDWRRDWGAMEDDHGETSGLQEKQKKKTKEATERKSNIIEIWLEVDEIRDKIRELEELRQPTNGNLPPMTDSENIEDSGGNFEDFESFELEETRNLSKEYNTM